MIRTSLRPEPGVAPLARPALLAILALLAALPARAAAQAPLRLPPLPVDTFSLDNGLRVIVSEDHSAPLVAVSMWYRVGSADEAPGRSGFAHLFEHLLFQETEDLEPGAMDRLVTRAGGVYNGSTDADRTESWELLPASRLNLALWLHGERMGRLRITRRGLATQREVVKEERRRSYGNRPYAGAQIAVDTLSQDYGPYRHPTIGTSDDLDAATVEDVRAFHDTYYVPGNAVLAVVGDVTPAEVRTLVRRYLGPVPRGAAPPPRPAPPSAPRTDGERRLVVPDPLARLPLVWMAFTTPPADDPDQYALSLLSTIFSGGESSRLHRRLVEGEGAALDLVSVLDRRLGTGTFRFGAVANEGVSAERLEALLQDEIDRLLKDGVTPAELARAKSQRRAAEVRSRLTVQGKAEELERLALHDDDPFLVNHEMERYAAVTVDDIGRVARTYLTAANRTVVVAQPEGGGAPDRGAAPVDALGGGGR